MNNKHKKTFIKHTYKDASGLSVVNNNIYGVITWQKSAAKKVKKQWSKMYKHSEFAWIITSYHKHKFKSASGFSVLV